MGIVPPLPGFTEALRRVTSAYGALLISDEVMTGFRCSSSGWYGLEGPYAGGAPDLFTFGKVMGGGFPAAAFGGRADIMAVLAPDGPVYQAGTLSGNPVATAAGLATLKACTPEVYDRLGVVSRTIADATSAEFARHGIPHVVQWAGSMFSIFFREGAVTNYDDARAQQVQAFTAFFQSMLSQGVHLGGRCTPWLSMDWKNAVKACTCPRAPSSRGSSAPPTMTRRLTGFWPRCPRRPGPSRSRSRLCPHDRWRQS
jgi:glutamate-1-semialdehyde 2,1-aminomutase